MEDSTVVDFIASNVGIAAVVVFVLYALAIYKVVGVLKQAIPEESKLKPLRIWLGTLVGLVTGPLIYPWVFALLGSSVTIPWYVAMIMGVGTGTTANVIYERMNREITGALKGAQPRKDTNDDTL